MKKLLFFIGMIFMVSIGCQKDEIFTDLEYETTLKNETTLKRAEIKMVPLKGEIIEIVDLDAGFMDCFGTPYPSRYLDISGHLTHLGNVAGGFADLFNCRMEIRNEVPHLVTNVSGVFKAANDDVLTYEGELWFSLIDMTDAGSAFNITGGSGRWKNAMGSFIASFEPQVDGTLLYIVNGEVTSPGKNKK